MKDVRKDKALIVQKLKQIYNDCYTQCKEDYTKEFDDVMVSFHDKSNDYIEATYGEDYYVTFCIYYANESADEQSEFIAEFIEGLDAQVSFIIPSNRIEDEESNEKYTLYFIVVVAKEHEEEICGVMQ